MKFVYFLEIYFLLERILNINYIGNVYEKTIKIYILSRLRNGFNIMLNYILFLI